MDLGYFDYPLPVNEPVLSYAPGTPERARLKAVLDELKSSVMDIPMIIDGAEVRTGQTKEIRPPHERKHLLANFHAGNASHVDQAIEAALKAREEW